MEAQRLEFRIRHRDGSTQRLTVDAESARVGSGAHCEIRLPAEDAAVEQLVVEARAGGVFAEARSLDPPTLLNGLPFSQGRILPESVMGIGQVELAVTVVSIEADASSGSARAKRQRSNPLVLLLGLVGFPIGFYMILTGKSAASTLPAAVPPPPLFADRPAECQDRDPTAARLRAENAVLQADAARESAPFRPEDGILAVELYDRARACFEAAADPDAAGAAKAAGERLRKKVADEFHVHRVRLERSLTTKAYEDTRVEVRSLLGYTGRRGGEYASWLSNLDRQIELKHSGKKRR
jgi:hypothetical protein